MKIEREKDRVQLLQKDEQIKWLNGFLQDRENEIKKQENSDYTLVLKDLSESLYQSSQISDSEFLSHTPGQPSE